MERDKYIPPTFRMLGKRGARRIDGFRKASGAALYTRDVILPGMLYARWLTCPYANARIVNMDTSKAEAFPGVRAVLRYDDPEVYGKRIPTLHGGEEDILAGFAYFQGQQLGAVVAADTEDGANEALTLIKVEWEERPFVLDPEEALEPAAPLARPEWRPEGNLLPLFFQPSRVFSFGNVEEGFQEADKIITFEARRRYHGCADAELVSGITKWDGQCAELWLHHQHPYEHK